MPSVNQLLNIKCKLVVIFMSIYTCTLKCNKNQEIIKDFENELMIKIFLTVKNEKKKSYIASLYPQVKMHKIGSHNQGKKKLYCIYKIASLTIE